jgi:hypothetical protein
MASTARPRIRRVRSAEATAKIAPAPAVRSRNTLETSIDPAEARRRLLADLMSDVKKCLENKSVTEKKAVAFAIKKIAGS